MTAAPAADPYRIALLPGDGIGGEVTAQAVQVLEAVGGLTDLRFDFDEIPAGAAYYREHGRDWPEGSEERCASADAILLGAIGLPAQEGGHGSLLRSDGKMAGWSAIVGNRIKLDLYANVRPVKLYPGVRHYVSGSHKQVWDPENVDMVFIRENTEDLYAGSGGILAPGGVAQVATDTRIVTRASSERVIRLAFETAMAREGAPGDKTRRVTAVVKDNILYGCRLFVKVLEEVGAEYPQVEVETILVDAFTQWLVRRPEHYDVVVAPNMFGDIITELGSALQGGMGVSVGCNVGARHGMFEPIHGSAPKHAGKNRVNPLASILSAGQALLWLGTRRSDPELLRAAGAVEAAVCDVLAAGEPLTYDLVGTERAAPMTAVTSAVVDQLAEHLPARAAS
ncbi:isocitrate/isopropylmalate dehydrogenase family protein [Actinacidiphila acididurans]|uniref:Isocitrate/isopropylmalate dehydrogenase family protein n=1 Tax=Actinacidiphila acididurans TaxID=2784346 RepID=A0ABS2TVE5_9ACTN|nr:isocitrate/isopropylmalate family dehydrogenase [Actinacidiphila acididurans]MBM9507310.1 isocitrate/isopropylmalate dehydrogenase family protein [Actinacidiphila acididurans]